jgi:hypothetical protein
MEKPQKIRIMVKDRDGKGSATAWVIWFTNQLMQRRQIAFDGVKWFVQPDKRSPFIPIGESEVLPRIREEMNDYILGKFMPPPIDQTQANIDASDKWAEQYADYWRIWSVKTKNVPKEKSALHVMMLTDHISHYLAEHDPMALRQGQEALNGKSFFDFLEKK